MQKTITKSLLIFSTTLGIGLETVGATTIAPTSYVPVRHNKPKPEVILMYLQGNRWEASENRRKQILQDIKSIRATIREMAKNQEQMIDKQTAENVLVAYITSVEERSRRLEYKIKQEVATTMGIRSKYIDETMYNLLKENKGIVTLSI